MVLKACLYACTVARVLDGVNILLHVCISNVAYYSMLIDLVCIKCSGKSDLKASTFLCGCIRRLVMHADLAMFMQGLGPTVCIVGRVALKECDYQGGQCERLPSSVQDATRAVMMHACISMQTVYVCESEGDAAVAMSVRVRGTPLSLCL